MWEAAERHKADEARKAAEAAAGGRVKVNKTQARLAAEETATAETIAKLAAPVAEPATPEQLAELRRAFPLLRRRRDPR